VNRSVSPSIASRLAWPHLRRSFPHVRARFPCLLTARNDGALDGDGGPSGKKPSRARTYIGSTVDGRQPTSTVDVRLIRADRLTTGLTVLDESTACSIVNCRPPETTVVSRTTTARQPGLNHRWLDAVDRWMDASSRCLAERGAVAARCQRLYGQPTNRLKTVRCSPMTDTLLAACCRSITPCLSLSLSLSLPSSVLAARSH